MQERGPAVPVDSLTNCNRRKAAGALRWCWLTLLAVLTAFGGEGSRPTAAELSNMSLEALMNTEVTSVSKKSQRLSDTAAAVFVITQEEIHRSGLTSVPELLRLVPGVQVARIDASRWAISVRGFNDEFSNKLLVLVDGRTVYTELFSGVYWDMQDTLVDDIERIEVIRGPGATMWGANAVNGVINIITKNARDTQGSLFSLSAGNEDRPTAAYRFGGRLGRATSYRLYTQFSDQHTPAPGNPEDTSWRALQAGLRVDSEISSRDKVMVQASVHTASDVYYRDLRILTPPWSTRTLSDSDRLDGFLLARWSHKLSSGELTFQAYFDQARLSDVWRKEGSITGDLEVQHRQRLTSRHELNWGVGIRSVNDSLDQRGYSLDPGSLGRGKYNFFLQDEWAILPENITLTAGSKFEHNNFTGFETEPSARLLWTPTSRQSIWTAVSRAVRTPSRADRGIQSPGSTSMSSYGLPEMVAVTGNPGFISEDLLAVEVGYRRKIASRLSLDSSWFRNRYTHLTGYGLGTPSLQMSETGPYLFIPIALENNSNARSYGTELAANLTITEHWRMSGTYSWLKLVMNDTSLTHQSNGVDQLNFGAPNAPQHQAQIHTDVDFGRGWEYDASVYHNGGIAQVGVPSYSRLDMRVGRRLSNSLEVSLNGQNLLRPEHGEFLAEGVHQMFPIRRSVYLRLMYWF